MLRSTLAPSSRSKIGRFRAISVGGVPHAASINERPSWPLAPVTAIFNARSVLRSGVFLLEVLADLWTRMNLP
jgi:hypothetical protein